MSRLPRTTWSITICGPCTVLEDEILSDGQAPDTCFEILVTATSELRE